ncbi:MAG TPA: amidohydrolase family protein [Chloroflexota bacterium]|nr:amidohydrolase family protein [Chloroflexota bacterium]
MVATMPRWEMRDRTRPALIDCDLHNELHGDAQALLPYLPARWRQHVETFGPRAPAGGFYPRFMDHREDARPPSGRRSGSDVAFTRAHYLDPFNVAHGILIPLSGAGGQQNLELSAVLSRAVNEWQVAEWLDPEPRLHASLTIPFEDPPAAVAEIRHWASDRRFVQVQFSGRPHEPMGRRKYWPIYEACAENHLQVMSHAFGSYGQPITGAGWPSFYLEEHVGPAQAMQANIISMVVEGVFERFPGLNVVSVENGFGWLPSLMWRLDSSWKLLHAEAPHLKRLPSEYIREHVYLSTQPMEEPHRPRHFLQLLDHFGDAVDHLMFASDYPHWDADDPDEAFPVQIPPELERKIYYENAAKLYGLGKD